MRNARTSLVLAAAWAALLSGGTQGADPAPAVSYFRDVRPIFQARCQGCHQLAKAEGGFVMTEVPRMLAAGDSGTAGVAAGRPAESELVARITPDAAGHAEMPKEGPALTAAELELGSGPRDDGEHSWHALGRALRARFITGGRQAAGRGRG